MGLKETLETNLHARIDEVDSYKLNIDNFKLAIQFAKEDKELADYTVHLETLLREHLLEKKKADIMVRVFKTRLREL